MKKLLQLLATFTAITAIIISCSKEEPTPEPIKYTLSVSAGTGGSVSSTGGSYEAGASVSVTATPNAEYEFTGWSNGSTDNPLSVTVNSNTSITANFAKVKYALNVTIEGEGTVTEEVVSTGKDYDSGTVVQYTAVPAEGWVFSNWSGAEDSIESTITLTADASKSITATFIEIPFDTASVGDGTIQIELVYNESNEATALKLTAVTPAGWRFDGWTGGVESTEMEVEVALDLAEAVTASFIKTYVLNITTEGLGSVYYNDEELLTSQIFDVNTSVLLTAVPENDWELQNWNGDVVSSENPLTVIVDKDISLNAKFKIAAFAGGIGDESDPFQISNVNELQNINLYPGANFVLINDIDAVETNNWNNGNGFIPIGSGALAFAGTLDGKEYSIKNLYVSADNASAALFSRTTNAIIKNLKLENVNINAGGTAGALIGSSSQNLEVSNIYITGSITGKKATGGLAGSINSDRGYTNTVSNINVSANVSSTETSAGGVVGYANWFVKVLDSSFDGTVNGGFRSGGVIGHAKYGSEVSNSSVTGEIISTLSSNPGWAAQTDGTGGIVGFSELGIVKNSHSSADVNGFINVGGLVGLFEESSWSDPVIYRSSSSGEVRGNKNVGGLVGFSSGQIIESFSSGIVVGDENIGGLVGLNADDSFCCGVGVISNSYSLGDVSGNIAVGGLIGSNLPNGEVSFSYSVGAVSGNTSVGGLVGLQTSIVASCYWDIDNSNITIAYGESYNNDGATGLNSENIIGESASENMTELSWGNIWKTTSSYPKLIWEE